jgi:hypothetical protein
MSKKNPKLKDAAVKYHELKIRHETEEDAIKKAAASVGVSEKEFRKFVALTDKADSDYMKDGIKKFGVNRKKGIKEDGAPANSVGAAPGHVAGISDNDPPGKKKGPHSKFAGCDVFQVDSDTFHKCMYGRNKHSRWKKSVNVESELGQSIRSYSQRNPGRSILLQQGEDGPMLFLRKV